MSEVYIISAVRTPFILNPEGRLARLTAFDLSAAALVEALHRSNLAHDQIEDVFWCCGPLEGASPAAAIRLSLQQAGFPSSVPAAIVNRHSSAGQQAIHSACQAILSGDVQVTIAGGVDARPQPIQIYEERGHWLADPRAGFHAEIMAEKWGLTRRALDEYTLQSLERGAYAHQQGYPTSQIAPLVLAEGDNCCSDQPLPQAWDAQSLAALAPLYKENGAITRGHLSQPAAGAAALVLASPKAVGRFNLDPLARVVARTVSAADFSIGLAGSIPATGQALKQAGLTINDLDFILVEEISASAVLAWISRWKVDPARVNPHGGALAQGHLPTAGGALLVTRLLYTLGLGNGHFGIAVTATPDGMGMATIIERL